MIIAIDGPAASGKGTLAKRVALHFGLPCLDTGLLYRAVAFSLLNDGRRLDDRQAALAAAQALAPASLANPALRDPGVGEAASEVASLPEVRAALFDFQRAFAGQPGGAVLDGRDIGTVICPDATVKIFVTAAPEVRAWRRFAERQERGEWVAFDAVLADIRRRDARDQNRDAAPLRMADDATLLDTTDLDIDGALEAALHAIKAAKPGLGSV